MHRLRRIWSEIGRGENLNLYLTIVAAIVLSIMNITGAASLSIVPSLTLALLALISLSLLGSRHQIEKILSTLVATEEATLVESFPSDMKVNIAQAKVLWLMGVSFLGILQEYYPTLERSLRSGQEVKALLVNHSSPACEIAASRDQVMDVDYQRSRIRAARRYLSALRQIKPNGVEVRLTENPLDFEVILCDQGDDNRVIYLRHLGFKTPLGTDSN